MAPRKRTEARHNDVPPARSPVLLPGEVPNMRAYQLAGQLAGPLAGQHTAQLAAALALVAAPGTAQAASLSVGERDLVAGVAAALPAARGFRGPFQCANTARS